MSIADDMFDLDDHFKGEAKGLQEAWERISQSHADAEFVAMKTEPVIQAIATILHQFNVVRKNE